MDEKKRLEIEDSLKKRVLMDNNDSLIATEKGDCWERFLFINLQTRGYYYFTKKSLIFIGGLGGTEWAIPYKNIQDIKKYFICFFIPTGIKISAYNKKNKLKKYRLSLLKRNKWIDFIEQKRKEV